MRLPFPLLIAGLLASAAVHAAEPEFTVEQLQQDVAFIRKTIDEIHPQPESSIPREQLDAVLDTARRDLSVPMGRDEAWRVLARLNPPFADAHFAVVQPEWRTQAEAFLASGGAFFPFEVRVTPEGKLFVRSELGGKSSALAGRRIERINGVPVAQLAPKLLQLAHGDTPQFRAELMSRRWWFFYWKHHGAPARFTLSIDGKPLTLAASRARPEAVVGTRAADFDQVFRFELLGKRAALLTINQFLWPDPEKFHAFTAAAFARMREAGTTTLLIDVRENGGGDDELWKRGILPYIATTPYRHTSAYIKKVLPGRGSETEREGDIVQANYDKWEQPEPGNPLRFGGRVYVLVGGMTYSSAVLFSNVMQDFGFGKLVGTGGYARARQSGGLQSRTLPHTGLELLVPRMVLDRPAGAAGAVMVQPDIVLADDPYNRHALVEALLRREGEPPAQAR
ncbi:hypothetical protein G4G28_03225 [Massilia sp. Dwa41.01b]|uniref:S41 family peptidase n=1 Tax=unclassified Massilia TaxID=2609279 RepID=UPI0016043241|nr:MULTISPECIES: S41 family peptidase [unclassified Massilia]QNA87728.1 hypothetical protein G4G28_03225 [Massilia sp. Dwa41.01b]QNA98627.1 hypothetical protein G4G31_06960 [Massilia sp. Se16.2.3]